MKGLWVEGGGYIQLFYIGYPNAVVPDIVIHARWEDERGNQSKMLYSVLANTGSAPILDRLQHSVYFQVAKSAFLVAMAINVSGAQSGKVTAGQLYIEAGTRDSLAVPDASAMNVVKGYWTNANDLCWTLGSNIPQATPQDGPGNIYSLAVASVASTSGSGKEWSQAVPAGALWKLHSVNYTFATSATVANRGMRLAVKDANSLDVFLDYFNVNQTASETVEWTRAPESAALQNSTITNNQSNLMSLPANFKLPAGFTIGSKTFNLSGGDQYKAITLLVEEWLVP